VPERTLICTVSSQVLVTAPGVSVQLEQPEKRRTALKA
jgi:hypothetical protein